MSEVHEELRRVAFPALLAVQPFQSPCGPGVGPDPVRQGELLERGFPEARLNVQHAVRSEGPASGAPAREDARDHPHPRGEGRDRDPSSRQERESTSTQEQPLRRPSRPRTER